MTHLGHTRLLAISIVAMLFVQIDTNYIHYHEEIVHHRANLYREVLNIPPSDLIHVKYNITFRTEKCCPFIVFQWVANGWETLPQKGYFSNCQHDDPTFVALYSPFYLVTRDNFPSSGCRVENRYHICEGKRTLSATRPMKWSVLTNYHCKNGSLGSMKSLELTMDLEVEYVTNYMFPCEPVKLDYCMKRAGFNYTAFPNALGQLTQVEANLALSLFQTYLPILKCYQHSVLFMCQVLYPTCHTGHKRLFPCQQMCMDAVRGCANKLAILNQPAYCGHLPNSLDPNTCLFEPVHCPKPTQPESGHIITKGVLLGNISTCTCDEGYEIQGDVVRHCNHSGLWNSSEPICISTDNAHGIYSQLVLTIFLPVLILFLLVMSLVVLCVYNRQSLLLLVCHNKRGMKKRESIHVMLPKKKIFVTYSSEDCEQVSKNFIPDVRRELPGWEVITYQENFLPGRPLMDCIKEGVWDSHAVLVLLTANFISSPMCCFEFTEAETRSVIDSQFRLIVVLFTKDNHKTPTDLATDFPEKLREYVRTRVYLHLGEPLFWNKLRRSLLKKTL